MSLTEMINPYLLYIKLALIALAVAGLFFGGVWIRGVFAERATLKGQLQLAEQAAADAIKQRDDYARLTREVVDAVKKIKIQSNNYIERIESEPSPAIPDSGPLAFIPAGMPKELPPSPSGSNSAGRNTTSAKEGGSL